MNDNKKVINIKYKLMDRDPEIKRDTNALEPLILGDSGVGLLFSLRITPEKVLQHLDNMKREMNMEMEAKKADEMIKNILATAQNSGLKIRKKPSKS